MTKIIGLIPARGGSKGIPGKNIKELAGKPLIAWTIEAALDSKILARILVSTDDEKIANVAREWGAEVSFMRPEYLSVDNSTSISVVHHAIQYLFEEGIHGSDYLLLLQPTSPLRIGKDIISAIDIAKLKDAAAVVSVTDSPIHPYLTKKITKEGVLENFIIGNFDNMRRQDMPAAYALNGAIYLNKISSLHERETFIPENETHPYIMPADRSIDIDTVWDFYLAELVLRDRQNGS
jgi:CMP-N,N'-diacetyllegionaminic acid synthase